MCARLSQKPKAWTTREGSTLTEVRAMIFKTHTPAPPNKANPQPPPAFAHRRRE